MTDWKNPRANPQKGPKGFKRGVDAQGAGEKKPSAWDPEAVLAILTEADNRPEVGPGASTLTPSPAVTPPVVNTMVGAAAGVANVTGPPNGGIAPAGQRRGALYSHERMVDLMIQHPDYTHAELAEYFGRGPGWMSSVLASQAFQDVLEPRRHLVLDPSLTANMEERFRALAIQGTSVLQTMIDKPDASDFLLVKVAEVSVKALGMGQMREQVVVNLPPAQETSGQTVAEKLLAAMDARDKARTIENVTTVETKGDENG